MEYTHAEKKNKILQEEGNFMIIGRKKDIMVSDYITNAQTNTITHSKTQINKQEDQPSKGVLKKSMIQQTLFQSYAYIKKRSRSRMGESSSGSRSCERCESY